ncbi:carbamoyltransferase HypF [Desulfovibrio sp. OttesenSCG-928-M14]|nr:carbamoyltransferase HypF [Desulfovibrio sp. OttesenSCG-928-M14]
MSVLRLRMVVQGQVQGVGFRPFIFKLAESEALTGFVRNSPRGVVIEIQGQEPGLEAFTRRLHSELPPLALLTGFTQEKLPPLEGESDFRISQSTAGSTHAVLISPDTCTCSDCLADMTQIDNRRFNYPFTNCTNCGPRYTITRSIPYDRAETSMACFPLCPECRAEYDNPRDRRFHAQPNACPVCGPKVWLCAGNDPGDESHDRPWQGLPQGDEALEKLSQALLRGQIAAIKGLGGFHLACDACDSKAVAVLRERKQRPHKPFAVMAADLDQIRRFAHAGPEEQALLLAPERPIVLCPAREQNGLSPLLSPDSALVGVMLPYTPLHFALFAHLTKALAAKGDTRPAVLVMTSGNPGGEPICLGNREALNRLGNMADLFLLHDRDILIRVDDSVVRPLSGRGSRFYRRARGYVPRPTNMAKQSGQPPAPNLPCVLGAGAELKNTLCLTKGSEAFVSQHIGDMANLESAAFHESIREHLAALLRVRPQVIVRDLHPDYLASGMADDLAARHNLPLFRLQHHAAHGFALLAEHAFAGKALVLALDGTGLGEDGALWGGECLLLDSGPQGPTWQRLAHLAPMDLPGAEAAIREPWRIAHALLLRLGLYDESLPLPWLPEQSGTAAFIPAMLERRINTQTSTSCGRLFDAVSALLGLCSVTSYEGQAAIRLEEAQGPKAWEYNPKPLYACPVCTPASKGPLVLDTHALFVALARDAWQGTAIRELALGFHHSLAAALSGLAVSLAAQHGVTHVGLSGGCLQNLTLSMLLARNLESAGLQVLEHRQMPPGDGCISLGQAYWGVLTLRAAKKDE